MSDKFMTPSHVEGDLMKKSGQFKLCEELQLILDKELKAGNTLLESPCCTNWPQEGSIFASLANRITVGKEVLTDDVYYFINDDVHYGWIDECVCKIHHDLLVAGNLITNKHKWFVLSNCSLLRVIVFVNNPISTATAAMAIKNNYIEGKAAPQGLGFLGG